MRHDAEDGLVGSDALGGIGDTWQCSETHGCGSDTLVVQSPFLELVALRRRPLALSQYVVRDIIGHTRACSCDLLGLFAMHSIG